MENNFDLSVRPNADTKFYVRCGQVYLGAESIVHAKNPKDAAIRATMRILGRLREAANTVSKEEYNRITGKMLPKTKIMISMAGWEKPDEYEVTLKEYGLSKESISSLMGEWKKNHKDDVFYSFDDVSKEAMKMFMDNLRKQQEGDDSEGWKDNYKEEKDGCDSDDGCQY